jgi:hypothetical protein
MARRKDPLLWGIVLVVIGLVFILENFDIDAWDVAWKFWPVILIVWGANKLFAGLKERTEAASKPQPPAPPAPPQV